MVTGFAQSLQSRQGGTVYLVHGGTDHTSRSAWYFVQVQGAKLKAFLRAIGSGSIDFNDYGSILESGYGEMPPESIVALMRTHYGYTG